MKSKWQLVAGSAGIALAITALGLIVAVFVARIQLQGDKLLMLHQAQSARAMLASRLDREQAHLLAARGFYLSSVYVSPREWDTFAAALYDGRDNGRVLLHLTYAPAGTTAGALARLHIPAEVSAHVHPHPRGDAEYYCPVDRAWPPAIAAQELGFNPCGTANHALFDRAAHGGVVASRSVPLLTGAGLQKGIVLIAAQAPGTSPDAVPPGWVAEAVPARALFAGLQPAGGRTTLEVEDVTAGDSRVLYRSPRERNAQAPGWQHLLGSANPARITLGLTGAGRTWRMVFAGESRIGWAPVAIGAAGMIISLLVAALFYALARTGQRAAALAEGITRDLSTSRQLLASVTNNVRDGIYRGVPEAGLIYVNRPLARLFGFASEAQMISSQGAIRYATPPRRDELRKKLFRDGHYEDEEVEYVRADGSHFIGLNSAWATRNDEGDVRFYDGVVTDITDRKAAERQIEFMAHFDRLTGLPNRTLLEDRFRQAAHLATRSGLLIAVLFIDLDNFKDINDLHGHDIGDLFLVEVAARLRRCIREEDTVARFGGDEFVVLASRISSVEAVTRIAHQMVDEISAPYEIAGLELHTTPSVGISLYPQDGTDLTTLSQNADAAMYQVKRSGRAGIAYFTQRLNEQAKRQVAIENALRHAIERGEISLAFQPRAALDEERINGVETLARWTHPDWGDIAPAEFIPAAERTGQIVALGKWILEHALMEWKRWEGCTDRPLRVGVNVSARQLRERGFAESVARALKTVDVPGEALELEITESMLVERLQASEATLDELKALNVCLALDDFGIGYSSLGYLKRFDIDVIKIDQSFVRDLLSDPNDAAIVRAVVTIARDLGVELVAEGVENEQQLAVLRSMQCESVQGTLLARPMPSDEFLTFLKRWGRSGLPEPLQK